MLHAVRRGGAGLVNSARGMLTSLLPLACLRSAAGLAVCASAARVTMLQCDASASADAPALVAAADQPPDAGVMHCAGILHDALLTAQTAASMRAVHAPKLAAAGALLSAVGAQPLSQLLLFSSAAALFGAPGQASYTAANAALEGWGAAAGASGLNTAAVQWGAWAAGALGLHGFRQCCFDGTTAASAAAAAAATAAAAAIIVIAAINDCCYYCL